MIYLLDVNALVALGVFHHELHPRVAAWISSRRSPNLATCSITEIGFVRVVSHVPAYGFTIAQARTLLLRLKRSPTVHVTFIPDAHDISHLPNWARTPKQITDGHLAALATANAAILATLDENIPGSYLIPKIR
jgi:predicted nucleic acid-binding protein